MQFRTLALFVLLSSCTATAGRDGQPDSRESTRSFPVLSSEEAWGRMSSPTPPLPLWARTLVTALPRTTAHQLDLDYLHRKKNPLGPVLSGLLRWTVADAIRCDYAKQFAEADLTTAGVAPEQVRAPERLSDDERFALQFARDLTLSAAQIPDEQVAELIERFGPDDAIAIVHTVAHANFQDRIFLALRLESEPDVPPSATQARPAPGGPFVAPTREASPRSTTPTQSASGVSWTRRSADELRGLVERQKLREPRIAPADPVRLARLARPDRARVAGSVWGKVSMGYQPALTSAWFETMRSFNQEAKLDDVFANSIFWVVTRTNDCFY